MGVIKSLDSSFDSAITDIKERGLFLHYDLPCNGSINYEIASKIAGQLSTVLDLYCNELTCRRKTNSTYEMITANNNFLYGIFNKSPKNNSPSLDLWIAPGSIHRKNIYLDSYGKITEKDAEYVKRYGENRIPIHHTYIHTETHKEAVERLLVPFDDFLENYDKNAEQSILSSALSNVTASLKTG